MAFCMKCGQPLNEGQKFCTACGAAQQAAPAPEATTYAPSKISGWDGGVLETIGYSLAASLLITVTCGIATPWAICFLYRFVIGHVTVDNKRLRFDGTGGDLFVQWLKWFLLTVITCGIYSFWVTPKLYHWIAKNTHFAD